MIWETVSDEEDEDALDRLGFIGCIICVLMVSTNPLLSTPLSFAEETTAALLKNQIYFREKPVLTVLLQFAPFNHTYCAPN